MEPKTDISASMSWGGVRSKSSDAMCEALLRRIVRMWMGVKRKARTREPTAKRAPLPLSSSTRMWTDCGYSVDSTACLPHDLWMKRLSQAYSQLAFSLGFPQKAAIFRV